jgi:hypothetical protein
MKCDRLVVTALPRQLQTLPRVPEFAELNTQPLAMRWRAYHQVRREFDISDEGQTKGGRMTCSREV